MLLPSALPCSSAQPDYARFPSSFMASPPASPPTMASQTAVSNIMTTCRSLQALLAAPLPSEQQMPTPPLAHAPPPLKLRLRTRPGSAKPARLEDALLPAVAAPTAPRRVAKRSAPPRGLNKRRRPGDTPLPSLPRPQSDAPTGDDEAAAPVPSSPQPQLAADLLEAPPSTPKRARIAPEQIPLGLERSDFHQAHLDSMLHHDDVDDAPAAEAESGDWTVEDDRILVELVLDKLKLSKTEWHDCARSLGKDRHEVARRWKSLVTRGDVGIKPSRTSRRLNLHATWR